MFWRQRLFSVCSSLYKEACTGVLNNSDFTFFLHRPVNNSVFTLFLVRLVIISVFTFFLYIFLTPTHCIRFNLNARATSDSFYVTWVVRQMMLVPCAGCSRPIHDQFLLNVLDQAWHVHCVQCADCQRHLMDKCFSRDGKIYCKDDFLRLVYTVY